jgi:hypothetical protein
MREIEKSAGARLLNKAGMKPIPPESSVLPAHRNRVLLAGDPANPDRLEDELDKYQHLKELANLFFAAKRHHLNVRTAAQP